MVNQAKAAFSTGTHKPPRKKKLTPEARYLKIQAGAYYLAEKDCFKKNAVEYWLAAEAAAKA